MDITQLINILQYRWTMTACLIAVFLLALFLQMLKISDKTKKRLAAINVVTFIALIVTAFVMTDLPMTISGNAAADVLEDEGQSGLLAMILSTAIIAGMIAYTTLEARDIASAPSEFATKSKYWVGYAVSRFNWGKKNKKPQTDIEVKVEENLSETKKSKPTAAPTQPAAKDEVIQEKTIVQVKDAKVMKEPNKKSENVREELSPEEKTKQPETPKTVEKPKPQATQSEKKNVKTDDANLMKRFGTKDPLAVAEAILRKREENKE